MKTAAQIWLDYGRTLDVGVTEKALAELDAEIRRLRAALKEIGDLQDRSFVSGEGLFMRAVVISRKALKPSAVEQAAQGKIPPPKIERLPIDVDDGDHINRDGDC